MKSSREKCLLNGQLYLISDYDQKPHATIVCDIQSHKTLQFSVHKKNEIKMEKFKGCN